MKNTINAAFAKFGLKPVFAKTNFERGVKNYANLMTIEQQAIDFVHEALKTVNQTLQIELKRNGYDPKDALNRKININALATESKTDKRFKSQTYSVDGFIILRVDWKPNGFTLGRNTQEKANENKKRLKAGLGYGTPLAEIKDAERKNVEIEALTNKKLLESK